MQRTMLCVAAAILASRAGLAEERIRAEAIGDAGVSWKTKVDSDFGIEAAYGLGDVDGDSFGDIAINALEDLNQPFALHLIYGSPRITGDLSLPDDVPRVWTLRVADPNVNDWDRAALDVSPAGDLDADGYGDFFLGYGLYPDTSGNTWGGMAVLVHGEPFLDAYSSLEELVSFGKVNVFRSSDPTYRQVGLQCRVAGDVNGDGELDYAITAPQDVSRTHRRIISRRGLHRLRSRRPAARGRRLAGRGRARRHAHRGLRGVPYWPRSRLRHRAGRGAGGARRLERRWLRRRGPRRAGPLAARGLRGAGREGPAACHPDGRCGVPPEPDRDPRARFRVELLVRPAAADRRRGRREQRWHRGPRALPGGPVLPLLRPAEELRAGALRVGQLSAACRPRRDGREPRRAPPASAGERALRDCISAAGDVDGDGRPDLLVGAPWATPEGRSQAGEAYVLLSREGFTSPSVMTGSYPGMRLEGAGRNEDLGDAVGAAGDFDGDGFDDVLAISRRVLGSRRDESPGINRAYLIYGGPSGPRPLDVLDIQPPFGPAGGGTTVRVSGSGFAPGTRVAFGGVEASRVDVLTSTELDVVIPPGTRGLADVSVSLGGTTRTLAASFFYSPLLPAKVDALGPRGFTIAGMVDRDLGKTIAAGDFDGDGIDDLALSSCRAPWVGGNGDCSVVLVRGRRMHADVAAFEGGERITSFRLHGPPDGIAVSAPGDINGDGINDLLIAPEGGPAYLVRGRSDWSGVEDVLDILGARGATEVAAGQVDPFTAVALGDITGDGINDFAVALGTQGQGPAGNEIVFVAGRRSSPSLLDLSVEASGRVTAVGAATQLGWQLVQAGDVNGDGRADLLANAKAGAQGPGQPAFLIHGDARLFAGGVETLESLLATPGRAASFSASSDEQPGGGLTVSGAGDVNGDGRADILLGMPQSGDGLRGRAYLVLGTPALASVEVVDGKDPPDGVVEILGDRAPHQNGRVSRCGDLDGDGFDEFAVSARSGVPPLPGYAHVVMGKQSLPRKMELGRPGLEAIRIDGIAAFDIVDEYADAVGDFNGDGTDDFVFRERGHAVTPDNRPAEAGRVYMILGERAQARFIRGDGNADGAVNIADPIATLSHLFLGGATPDCADAADADDDGALSLTDAVYVLNHLFKGGLAPLSPYPAPGIDPTTDGLDCARAR